MSFTTPATGNILKKWETDYFAEYVRESGFNPYMGTSTNSPFVVKKQLIQGGQVITIPLVTAFSGGNVGAGTLTGNEEALGNFSYDLKPYWHRFAAAIKKSEEQNSVIDLLNASKDMLKVRDMDDMRDSIINALGSITELSSAYKEGVSPTEQAHPKEVFFSESTASQKNAWSAANRYRILYGNAEANYNATFATAAANVDTTNDKFTVSSLALLKRMAKRRLRIQKGDSIDLPSIRPIRTGSQGREYFVCFVGPEPFSDLKIDMRTINLDGRPRDVESNPIFQDGDLIVDGVVVREIPEISNVGTIGASSATVYPVYFTGAQALGIAWGQTTRATQRKEDDYGFIKGVGVESLWSAEKLRYNGIDHGMITGFFAAT
jgi:hypothetical protein